MKVQRFMNPLAEQQMIRVMQTTCPLCHKAVQFAMQDSDFVAEETESLVEENAKLRESILRLTNILDHLTRR